MISVIIPVFNRPMSAIRAARSALSQRLEPGDTLEVVLVDDASSPAVSLDNSGLDLNRIRVLRLEQNSGPSAARNRGIEASTGEFIAFLDSDDLWEPDKLIRQLALFRLLQTRRDKALLGIVCGFYYPNHTTGRLEARLPIAGREAVQFASGCWTAPGTVLLVHRTVFERVGLFDSRLRRLEDFDWLLRFGLAGGRLEVVDHMGAVIVPSGLARSAVVGVANGQLADKYGDAGEHLLPGKVRRRFKAYLALERAAAEFADERRFQGGLSLLRSIVLKPRLTASLLPFWRRSQTIPPPVAERYRELLEQTT